jgi:hypothetical protein
MNDSLVRLEFGQYLHSAGAVGGSLEYLVVSVQVAAKTTGSSRDTTGLTCARTSIVILVRDASASVGCHSREDAAAQHREALCGVIFSPIG